MAFNGTSAWTNHYARITGFGQGYSKQTLGETVVYTQRSMIAVDVCHTKTITSSTLTILFELEWLLCWLMISYKIQHHYINLSQKCSVLTRSHCVTYPTHGLNIDRQGQVWLITLAIFESSQPLLLVAIHFTKLEKINININNCSIELKWDSKQLKEDMITRWG